MLKCLSCEILEGATKKLEKIVHYESWRLVGNPDRADWETEELKSGENLFAGGWGQKFGDEDGWECKDSNAWSGSTEVQYKEDSRILSMDRAGEDEKEQDEQHEGYQKMDHEDHIQIVCDDEGKGELHVATEDRDFRFEGSSYSNIEFPLEKLHLSDSV